MIYSDHRNEECVKLFCKTVAELNAISLTQLEGLLKLAVTAVEAAGSKIAANGAQQFIDELKATAEEISRTAQLKEEELYKKVKEAVSAESEEYFCSAVEERLIIALENSLANQQQLNVTGNAILAQATLLLLSEAGK